MGTNYYWNKEKIKEVDFLRRYLAICKQSDAKFFKRDYEYAYGDFGGDDFDEYVRHIGKISAAGYYCPDCWITLCEKGFKGVHIDGKSYDKCPMCGKPAHELDRICSFTWYDKNRDNRLLGRFMVEEGIKDLKLIVDEYGKEFTIREFFKELDNCKIEYQSGSLFS